MNSQSSALEQSKLFNETKQKILYAASEVFAEKGFKSSTTREIADTAGVNIASLHYYFGNKEDLYLFVIEYWLEMSFKDFPYAALTDPATPSKQRFELFLRETINTMFQKKYPVSFTKLFVHEAMITQTEAFDSLIKKAVAPNTQLLKEIIDDMTNHKFDDKALDYYTACTIGQCLFYHTNQNTLMPVFNVSIQSDDDISALADHIVAYSLSAILNMDNK